MKTSLFPPNEKRENGDWDEVSGSDLHDQKRGLDVVPQDPALKMIVDDTTTANVTYLGWAAPGSATSAAVWRVQKIDETGSLTVTWADSNSNFDNIFDNRASLTYG